MKEAILPPLFMLSIFSFFFKSNYLNNILFRSSFLFHHSHLSLSLPPSPWISCSDLPLFISYLIFCPNVRFSYPPNFNILFLCFQLVLCLFTHMILLMSLILYIQQRMGLDLKFIQIVATKHLLESRK